jgi:hypothetical protein
LNVSVLSLVVIGLISGGLTFKVTGDVNYAFTDAVERVAVRAVGYLAEVKDTVLGPRDADSEGRSPGETWALITGQGMVMGLDRDDPRGGAGTRDSPGFRALSLSYGCTL